jgi:hypothetical protein
LDVHKKARRVQVGVAGKVDVVDSCPLKDGRLLFANVWSQEQDPVVGMGSGELGSPAIQLLGHNSGVLVAEVTLLLEQIAHSLTGDSNRQEPIEPRQLSRGSTDVGLRHPLVESGPVQVKICRWSRSGHVREHSMFINNEHNDIPNAERCLP